MGGCFKEVQKSEYDKNIKKIKEFFNGKFSEVKNELKKRLINRNQNTKREIADRFKSFDDDIKHWNDYDYIIINKNLETCFNQLESIILSNKKDPTIYSEITQ